MQQYAGGWQLLLPNAGDACTHAGNRHVFHGEGSLAPWDWATDGDTLILRLDFFSLPLTMTRRLRLDGDLLTIAESLTNTSVRPVELVWGQHPGFGGALLDGPARLTSGARRITVDSRTRYLRAEHESDWPYTETATGERVDLRTPLEGQPGMAYLRDFTSGWAGLTQARIADRLSVTQSQVARIEKKGYEAYTLTTLRRYVQASGQDFRLEITIIHVPRQEHVAESSGVAGG